ncbi:hypothetical protein SLEP1_g9101 [Rubroshorea leprosula]|uniref:Uncharacterized protein n=1 Tax=Rubroshorea leprosula TaxID=152421 RepID=A0AAV5IDP3_9ROSI|nr:hypothetical protein SLEP1_g9101 [Rubroshorea leprosula]
MDDQEGLKLHSLLSKVLLDLVEYAEKLADLKEQMEGAEDFPEFTKEDVKGWVQKCGKFFDDNPGRVPEKYQALIVSLYLDEETLEWHERFMKRRSKPPSWKSYVTSLIRDCGEKGARKNSGKAPQPQEHESGPSGDLPSTTLIRMERKMKGLCFNCDEKYTRGHNCNGEKSKKIEESTVGGIQCEIPYISGHALMGWRANHPLRLVASVESTPIKILVDSSSTHNFLNPAKVGGMSFSAVFGNASKFSTGNGSVEKGSICKGFKWRIDSIEFETDVIGLTQLEVCDMVLGNQWLATLGTVVWDFKQSRIGFTYQGKKTVLKSYAEHEWQKVGTSQEIDDSGNRAGTESDIPCISAHSLHGWPANIPMRLIGYVQSTAIKILVDLSSTHNFLNLKEFLRKRNGRSIITLCNLGNNDVEVAGGTNYKGKTRICKGFKWTIMNIEFESDMLMLPIENGCDVVLGNQWLATLGPILWDFKQCRMQFAYQGERVSFESCAEPEWQLFGQNEVDQLRQSLLQSMEING